MHGQPGSPISEDQLAEQLIELTNRVPRGDDGADRGGGYWNHSWRLRRKFLFDWRYACSHLSRLERVATEKDKKAAQAPTIPVNILGGSNAASSRAHGKRCLFVLGEEEGSKVAVGNGFDTFNPALLKRVRAHYDTNGSKNSPSAIVTYHDIIIANNLFYG
ncbi:hypothetical protein HD806DRAFT_533124 [Xylariaceae sp. AK1471]|nr:hypothetical protein HD806DRAFT_533124 [Xylariaceae sp. AK1471]